jgi:flagellin
LQVCGAAKTSRCTRTKTAIKKELPVSIFSVNTNLGAMAALQALSQTQTDLNTTQNAISTGLKVGQASDNPAIYTIAQTMNDTISGLSAVSDNLNFAQSVLGTASAAATQISSQLATLQNTITNGQQSGISTATVNAQINSILTNIDAFASAATFNGVNLSTGGLTTTQDASGTALTVGMQNLTSAQLGLTNLTTTSGGVDLGVGATTAFANDDYVQLSNGTQSTYFVLSSGAAAPTAPHATDANNSVIFVNFNVADSAATVMSKLAASMQQNGYGAQIATTANGTVNAGDLVMTGQGITQAASSLHLATPGTAALTSVTGATAAITTVTNAITTLNTSIANLGSAQDEVTGLQNFTTSLSDSLTSGLGALTDADMAAESAQLTSLQTKQQLGIQALSIANQQPQALLTLFRG